MMSLAFAMTVTSLPGRQPELVGRSLEMVARLVAH
jgi:hypothetical protein